MKNILRTTKLSQRTENKNKGQHYIQYNLIEYILCLKVQCKNHIIPKLLNFQIFLTCFQKDKLKKFQFYYQLN